MATHRIAGTFTAVMDDMEGYPVDSAEILLDLLSERFGYLKRFDVTIMPSDCHEEDGDAR